MSLWLFTYFFIVTYLNNQQADNKLIFCLEQELQRCLFFNECYSNYYFIQ